MNSETLTRRFRIERAFITGIIAISWMLTLTGLITKGRIWGTQSIWQLGFMPITLDFVWKLYTSPPAPVTWAAYLGGLFMLVYFVQWLLGV